MATPRKYLIDPEVPLFYHLVSRCVQRAFLCGQDPVTGRNYGHRKDWLIDRLHLLVRGFAVDLHGYCILSNHFHLCVFHDPRAWERWSDAEVAERWLTVSPPRTRGREPVSPAVLAQHRQALLADPERLAHVRRELGSVSTFMKFLKQHIARRANTEEGVTGHFFEQRFWSAALLSERAVLTALVYIDLNPVRAGIARRIEEIRHAGLTERLAELEAQQVALDDDLKPLVSGLNRPEPPLRISLRAYLALVQVVVDAAVRPPADSSAARWQRDVASLHRKQRAYGTEGQLRTWGEARNWKRFGAPLAA